MIVRWRPQGVLAIALATGVALGAFVQAQATRREPQFENEFVRVWKSVIMPNQPLTLHRHDYGRTIVALRGGTLDVVDGKGRTVSQVTWETGKAYWLDADPPGEQHGDVNRGSGPVEVMVIEMRR
jgi:beta-alanine degradation protein BauB